MRLGDRPEISESQLIGNAVLDRQGYLLGTVSAVNELPDNQFALVVEFPASKQEMDDLVIESHHLKSIDTDNRTIHTHLDFNQVVPEQGKTIPLVQEKLVVTRQRHKLGEIVVRKVVETDWVQIPVHREKLVVQTVGKPEPLTEITLGETRLPPGTTSAATPPDDRLHHQTKVLGQWPAMEPVLTCLQQLARDKSLATLPIVLRVYFKEQTSAEPVQLEFPSATMAVQLLPSIAHQWGPDCQSIRVEQR
jgi:hypothetical protein